MGEKLEMDAQEFRLLRSLYEEATFRGVEEITFQGHPILVSYAKYLIEHIETNFPHLANGGKFERAVLKPPGDLKIKRMAAETGRTIKQIRDAFDADVREYEIWRNDLYQVHKRIGNPEVIHLSIRRLDRGPVHDWRDLQMIKNELVGPENEAVEIYPAESRLVDEANQYHLWVFADPEYRIPFGFHDGRVVSNTESGGSRQRATKDYE